jgi:hypothetical protein
MSIEVGPLGGFGVGEENQQVVEEHGQRHTDGSDDDGHRDRCRLERAVPAR